MNEDTFGIDVTPEALEKLSVEERFARQQEYFKRLNEDRLKNPGKYGSTSGYKYKEAPPRPEENPEVGRRETFAEALEDAFWNLGGVAMLESIGRKEPLEFLKLCAKLINVVDKSGQQGITVQVVTLGDNTKVVEGIGEGIDKPEK